MRDLEFLVAASTCVLSAVFICSGLGKIVSPRHARQFFTELLRVRRSTAFATVRAVAVAEVSVGVGLLLPAGRDAAGVAAVALGASFAVAGVVGWHRRTTLPCGCFGRAERRPLGARNVLIGVAIGGSGALVFVSSVAGRSDQMAVMTASVVLGMALLLWRGMIVDLIRPPARPSSQAS
ncbi:MauE/DoxX family redox-associated membrane protein [Micromonospora sp. NPDC023814]|uniref:MauE/DoxX family redox-associated membrane protein n=1 Tax=Micromonospora sp. NPDC023814 TaxID=3154596 RepID=UPI0033C7D752